MSHKDDNLEFEEEINGIVATGTNDVVPASESIIQSDKSEEDEPVFNFTVERSHSIDSQITKEDQEFIVQQRQEKIDEKKVREVITSKHTGLYYKLKLPQEIEELGAHYQNGIGKGYKNFGIFNIGKSANFIETLMGVAVYFEHFKNFKVAILTNQGLVGSFPGLSTEKEVLEFSDDNHSVVYQSLSDRIDLWNIDSIVNFGKKQNIHLEDYNQCINEIFALYDTVIVDIPAFNQINNASKYFYPIISRIDNVDYYLEKKKGKMKILSEAVKYFDRYSINKSGVIFRT